MDVMGTQIREKTREDRYLLEILLTMFKRGDFRKNHPQQRKADKWKTDARDGLVATVIKHEDVDSIKICEQIINGKVVLWLADGLQRLTTLEMYKKGLFKLGKNVEFPYAYYRKPVVSENGEPLVDEYGQQVQDVAKYDLRGKGYSDLPNEVRELFDNYNITVVKQLDCTDEEVGYHIRRYNHQTSMNSNETAITYMDHIAKNIKEISWGHGFFKNCGKYTLTEKNNGTLERIVCESLMAMFYLDDWQKNSKKMGAYLNENATDKEFEILDKELECLEIIVGDKYKEYFNSKNSYIFFSVYHEFKNHNADDSKFKDFLDALSNELHSKKVMIDDENISFDEACENRATKDRSVVKRKISILTKLMEEFVCMDDKKNEESNIVEFIASCTKMNIKSVEEDIDFFEQSLEVLLDTAVKVESKLRENSNHPSILAMMAYSFTEDVDLENWLTEFASRNNTYIMDQKQNFLHMKQDFENYYQKHADIAATA